MYQVLLFKSRRHLCKGSMGEEGGSLAETIKADSKRTTQERKTTDISHHI